MKGISAAFRMCRLFKQVDLVLCECSTDRVEKLEFMGLLDIKSLLSQVPFGEVRQLSRA